MDECHFCGGPTPCDCTTECKHCPHIGHEHSADGTCRGTNFDVYPFVQEECAPHQYEPKEVSA